MPVRAVTFDFWRTLFRDNLGRERHRARVKILADAVDTPHEDCKQAMKHVMQEFLRVHIAEQRTLGPKDAIPMLQSEFDIHLAEDTHETVCQGFATAILEFPPEPIKGALDAVRAAAEYRPVGLISDTGISPGSSLVELLDRCGFLPYFTALTFSDEVGVAKPQAAMYLSAAHQLGVNQKELFHIGDLEPTDISGALAVGARAGLFGGDNDRYIENSRAHHVFRAWPEFVDLLPELFD